MAKKEEKKSISIQEKQTLGRWLISKVNTKDYRAGKVTGMKHPAVDQSMIDEIGRSKLLKQAAELEKEGLISVEWKAVRTDIKKINFCVDRMPQLCEREGVSDPKEELEKVIKRIDFWKGQTGHTWLLDYYEDVVHSLKQGKIPVNTADENIFLILNTIADLKEDMWKRKFSKDVLGDSKKFKEIYENRIITILINYSPKSDEAMTKDEILAQHGIMTYSQTLDVKGRLICTLRSESDAGSIDSSKWIYGCILNAQTLMYYEPSEISGVKKIITIENKANYESMSYQSDTLYIFTHGFFSPKEQRFLKKLNLLASEQVEFYHWSDMDFGGIRIFNHIKKNIFPKLIPLHMSKADYEAAIADGAGIAVKNDKLEKIRAIDAGMLDELKQCIIQYGQEIEQESLLD